MTKELYVARDFSKLPAGRYRSDGPHSGEVFREDYLIPNLEKGLVIVILDGTDGYPSSFLEEAFGGLARSKKWKPSELRQRLVIKALTVEYEPYRDRALDYMAAAIAK
ncbi:MAG: STAS-like domain-containing protein [Reyranella sp.]|nr:STAS-like domain-containing protein [Reyranella sp.]